MKIFFGSHTRKIDVTNICLTKLMVDNIVTIPTSDHRRSGVFTDCVPGVLKSVFIVDDFGNETTYSDELNVIIDTKTNVVTTNPLPEVLTRLKEIHSNLMLDFGSFRGEFPEQLMVAKYLKGTERVLEIGGNIGRNSMVIAYILNKVGNNQFLSLESDSDIATQLFHNKNLNRLDFQIENAALSKRKLIQQGWQTIVSDVVLPGYKEVNTITMDQINAKYRIKFDTLVLDCEGAFYYSLMDMPEILNNINMIIMKNDYVDIDHKNYVGDVLTKNNFRVDHSEAGGSGPCSGNFYEVWARPVNAAVPTEQLPTFGGWSIFKPRVTRV